MSSVLVLVLCFSPSPVWAVSVVGALAPHHDVAVPLLEAVYERLAADLPDPARVVLIGPDHFLRACPNIVCSARDWRTPFGRLRGDRLGAERLGRCGAAPSQDGIFPRDHSITEHIPRVRAAWGDVPVLAILVRPNASDLQILKVRRVLESLLSAEGGVVILSMDLSHYKPRDESDEEAPAP